MEEFVANQIKYGLKYLPVNLAKSFFIKQSNKETVAIREKGFIRGVCHPSDNYKQVKDANIEWIRNDIPYPFDEEGNVTDSFLNYKEACRKFVENGIKVMGVTPYPHSFISAGVDLKSGNVDDKIKEVAVFLAKELQGLVGAFQVTNEMGIPRFTIPLTMQEAAHFIAVQLEALDDVKGDILIGYNSAGPQADLHYMLKPYHKYCDYIGVDIYIGCFYAGGFMWLFDALIRYLYAFTGKPILLQEFGYIGAGSPKTKAQKKEILQCYGADSEKAAKADMVSFVDKMPKGFADHVRFLADNNPDRFYNLIFKSDLVDHLYRELPAYIKIPGYPHTPEGQGKFFSDILSRLYAMPCVCGAIIYCYQDSDHCYVCGQKDCPVETRWGLVDCDGNPKPAYNAVREEFGKIKWFESLCREK